MSEQDNIESIKQGIALLNAHDIDAYVQRYDESYVSESEISGELRGPAAARQQLESIFAAFPDLHIKMEQIFASGDHVVARARFTGTHQGNFMGITPTNKRVSWGACSVVEYRNGKVARSRLYGDHASFFEQLGVLSIPRATAVG
jgi:steroid delta-isomerase-like uncharacterized protein